MPKTKDELNQIKTEYELLSNKLKDLTKEELEAVRGGHGKNGKPTLVLWDEASSGLINDSENNLGHELHPHASGDDVC